MRNVSREAATNKSGFFTKETLGMTLILFSSVTIILLLLSDVLFSKQIAYTQFLYGCMGYFSFALFAALCFVGIFLVLDKKISKGAFKRAFLISALLFLALCLVQIITEPAINGSFKDYVTKCYENGKDGLVSCSGGGALFAVIVYPILSFIGDVGSYIVIALLMIGDILLLFRLAIKNAVKKATSKNRVSSKNIVGVKEYDDINFDFGNSPSMQPVQNKLYYGTGNGEFSSATKKERKSDKDKALNILYPESNKKASNKDSGTIINSGTLHGFNSSRTGDFSGKSYQNQSERDFEQKVNYIKTPQQYDSRNDYNTSFDRRANVSERRTINNVTPSGNDRSAERESATFSFDRSIDFNSRSFTSDRRDNENRLDRNNLTLNNRENTSDFISSVNRTPSEEASNRTETSLDNILGINLNKIKSESGAIDRIKSLSDERSARFEETEEIIAPTRDRSGIFEQNEVLVEQIATDSSPFANKWDEIKPTTNKVVEDKVIPDFGKTNDIEPIKEEVSPSNVTKFNLNPEKKAIYIESDTSEAVMPEEEKKKSKTTQDNTEQIPLMEQDEYIGIPEMPLRYKYKAPPIDLYKDNPKKLGSYDDSVEERCKIIEKTLESFNIYAKVENVVKGPTITRYEISIPEGTPVSKVPPRASDLAMWLEVESVRIEAPIPGKNLIGIELPNKVKDMVGMKELLLEKDFQKSSPDALSIVLGEDVVGNPVITDLTKTPHLLVAGATGMGKSVFLNALIMSLVTKYGPEDLRLVLVDPKQVEFTIYENLPHLLINQIITEASLCIGILDWAIDEMELRYKIFRSCFAQKIDEYNHAINPKTQRKMPKIVIIIDELGDLFSISSQIKHDIEDRIKRLTQKARAAGIHVVVATQRPDVTVITGVIKTNLPSRIAFKVLNYADSNTILNDGGAERLLGNGDMIFKTSNSALLKRIQGAYVSKDEILRVLSYIRENNACYYDENAKTYLDAKKASTQNGGTAASISFGDSGDSDNDPKMFNNIPIRNLIALRIVIEKKQASISALQRSMSIGYSTAGRIIDWMEKMNYISKFEGSKAREVLISMDEFERLYGEAELD